MSLSNCRECGHQVSASAAACPSCGAPEPTVDREIVARKRRYVKPWIAWPVVLVAVAFGWHVFNLPATGGGSGDLIVESVNPITNVVVLQSGGTGFTRLGHEIGASMAAEKLNAMARERFDVWTMVVGYRVVVR